MEDLENMMQPTQVDVDASYEDLENIISSQFTMTMMTKEYGIEGRYNWRGPPYHMNIHALQTVLHLYEKCLFDVQLPRIR